MKKHKIVIGMILMLIAISITSCGNKETVYNDGVYYNKFDEDRNVIIIKDEAFEVIKDMDFTKIKENLAPELYIAHFGYEEMKDFQEATYNDDDENPIRVIEFEDIEGEKFIIFPENNELVCKEIPRGTYDKEYLGELINAMTEESVNKYLNEFVDTYLYDNSRPEESFRKNISLLKYEFAEKESKKTLSLYFGNGEVFEHGMKGGEYTIREDNFDVEEFLAKNNIISDDINSLIESNGYKLIKQKITKENDYILLAKNDKTLKIEILNVDGKTKDIISSVNVPIGDLSVVKPENIVMNQIPDTDEYLVVYSDDERLLGVYSYSNDSLTDIRTDFDALPKSYYDNYRKRFYFYYPEENKTYVMKIEDYMQDDIVEAYINGEDVNASIYSKGYRLLDTVNNEIAVETLPSCYLIADAHFATVKQTFRWEDGNWNIVSSDWDYTYDISEVSGVYREEWFPDDSIKITTGNIKKIFNMIKTEALGVFGEPEYAEGEGDAYLIYDKFTLVYTGEAMYWGPNSIILHSEDDEIFGVKPGMTFDEIKKILGEPRYEGDGGEGGDFNKLLTYNRKIDFKIMIEGDEDIAERIIVTVK